MLDWAKMPFWMNSRAHRNGVEAAGNQPAVRRIRRGVGIQVEGLRVELEGEVDDRGFGESEAAAHEAVAGGEVVEVAGVHGLSPVVWVLWAGW